MLDKIFTWLESSVRNSSPPRDNDTPDIIKITHEDIEKLSSPSSDPLIITPEDLDRIDADIMSVTFADLARINEEVLRITAADIPPLLSTLKILPQDLPNDFTNTTTNCYHGTSLHAAKKILRQGFKVGPGNVMGSGIYFSIGGVTIARGYVKGNTPCIIHAKVDWGKVAYLDDPKIPKEFKTGNGNSRTEAALRKGYHSFIASSKYSEKNPTIGIVLGKRGTFIRPPRIVVLELINPRTGKLFS